MKRKTINRLIAVMPVSPMYTWPGLLYTTHLESKLRAAVVEEFVSPPKSVGLEIYVPILLVLLLFLVRKERYVRKSVLIVVMQ